MSKGKALKDYNLYLKFKQETSSKQDSYDKLCAHLKMSSQTMEGKEAALTSIETKWQKIGAQVSRTQERQNLNNKSNSTIKLSKYHSLRFFCVIVPEGLEIFLRGCLKLQ